MPQGVGVGFGFGVAVLVVIGCVPEGEALGRGVTVFVGFGLARSGVMLAVGRGPGGTGTLGSGEISLGVCASVQTTSVRKIAPAAHCNARDIEKTSRLSAGPDVTAVLMRGKPCRKMNVLSRSLR